MLFRWTYARISQHARRVLHLLQTLSNYFGLSFLLLLLPDQWQIKPTVRNKTNYFTETKENRRSTDRYASSSTLISFSVASSSVSLTRFRSSSDVIVISSSSSSLSPVVHCTTLSEVSIWRMSTLQTLKGLLQSKIIKVGDALFNYAIPK